MLIYKAEDQKCEMGADFLLPIITVSPTVVTICTIRLTGHMLSSGRLNTMLLVSLPVCMLVRSGAHGS